MNQIASNTENHMLPSYEEEVQKFEGIILQIDSEKYRDLLLRAEQGHTVLKNHQKTLTETVKNIEERLREAREKLSEILSVRRIEENMRAAWDDLNKDMLEETFAPHRRIHKGVKEKLQNMEDDSGTTPEEYVSNYVQSTPSPIDDILWDKYRNEAVDILISKKSREAVSKEAKELGKKLETDFADASGEVKFRDQIRQYVIALEAFRVHPSELPGLPKELVDGLFGHMPDEEQMSSIFNDANISVLDSVNTSSFSIIFGGQNITAYGADELQKKINEARMRNPYAKIVHLHQHKDGDLLTAAKMMGEGRMIMGFRRNEDGSSDHSRAVKIMGKAEGHFEIEGGDGITLDDFMKRPFFYIAHDIHFDLYQEEDEERPTE